MKVEEYVPKLWVGAHARNFHPGRGNWSPMAVVVHLADGTLVGTRAWFNSVEAKVSAHYGVGIDGTVHQYVKEVDTAQHCGVIDKPVWSMLKKNAAGGYINPNLYTLGIEHEGKEMMIWTDEMYESSSKLIAELCQRWVIPLTDQYIIPHHWIRNSKTCPGKNCDISRLIRMAVEFNTPPSS